MATDWAALQAKFLLAHEQSGISVKQWCTEQGLKYASARRHIKLQSSEPQVLQTIERTQTGKQLTQVTTRVGAPIGNRNAVRHSGYSQYYFDPVVGEWVEASSLDDELMLCRSRIHTVLQAMADMQEKLAQQPSVEAAAKLYLALGKAELALDKNIARVESITKTLSSLALDALVQKKLVADTKRSNAAAKLIRLQIDKLRKELGGSTRLDAYIDKLTAGHDHVVN